MSDYPDTPHSRGGNGRGPRRFKVRFRSPSPFQEVCMTEDDLAEAMRQRSSALAILECATIPEVIAEQTEVRLRAERRADQALLEQLEAALQAGDSFFRKLNDQGITRTQYDRWTKLALMPNDQFSRKITKRTALAVAGMTNDTADAQ
jgi:hypothetical protein